MSKNNNKLPHVVDKTPRQLVEETFINMGFTDENPSDLDMVTELLDIWRENEDDRDISYSAEQYILLNDPDVQQVLNKCKAYYEPKKHLSKTELRQILEDIARGKIKRQDYDFKNGEIIYIEPTFTERIQAVKMLTEGADDDTKVQAIQFVNNIMSPQSTSLPKPNMEAPTAPPPNHYSLKLEE